MRFSKQNHSRIPMPGKPGTCRLQVRDLGVTLEGESILRDITFQLNCREIMALIGPNGAGKTTAFNCITGVYEPTNGRISFLGEPIVENHPQGRMQKLYQGENQGMFSLVLSPTPDRITQKGIARTFQNIRLFSALTVFENVLIAKHMRARQNVFSAAFRLNRAEEKRMREEAMSLLEEQNLAHLKDEVAGSLPYGLQRHLEIARALATAPKLMLLDEPAAGMNPQETQELTDFIHKIRDEYDLSILMIEHHMDVVSNLCDHVTVLNFGKMIALDEPEAIQNNPEVIAAYLGGGINA